MCTVLVVAEESGEAEVGYLRRVVVTDENIPTIEMVYSYVHTVHV